MKSKLICVVGLVLLGLILANQNPSPDSSFSSSSSVQAAPVGGSRGAACYLRRISGGSGQSQFQQGSGTLLRFEGLSGVYVLTAYHVTHGMGGARNSQLYVPSSGSFSVSDLYVDTGLDASLVRVDGSSQELLARALLLDGLTAATSGGVSTYTTYNDAVSGGAVDAVERSIYVPMVEQITKAIELPSLQLQGGWFLDGVSFKYGQSGSLVFAGAEVVGLASTNLTYKGRRGHMLVPFAKIKKSLLSFAQTERERQFAVSNQRMR